MSCSPPLLPLVKRRPKKALGRKELWERAEAMMAEALDAFVLKTSTKESTKKWKLNPGAYCKLGQVPVPCVRCAYAALSHRAPPPPPPLSRSPSHPMPYHFNTAGDGAFYGPKIDIKVFDALGRRHQCATIQLDFQLPVRFNLRYKAKTAGEEAGESAEGAEGSNAGAAGSGAGAEAAADSSSAPATPVSEAPAASADGGSKAAGAGGQKKSGKDKKAEAKAAAAAAKASAEEAGEDGQPKGGKATSGVSLMVERARSGVDEVPEGFERPVIIHRAILGSVERFMAVLIEHTAGKWPFWLSPRQVSIVPVALKYLPYAEKVAAAVHAEGFFVDVDSTHHTLNKKVREAQLAQYNYILVVGEKEEVDGSVNIRTRDNVQHGTKPLAEFVTFLRQQADTYQ